MDSLISTVNKVNQTAAPDFLEVPLSLRFCDAFVFFCIWLLALFSTIIIFYLFSKTVSLREVSGYLMVTLTSIDFLTAQFFLFPSIYTIAVHEIPWANSVLCDIQGFTNVYLQNFKSLTITLCALDRVFSIASPFSYGRYATTLNFWIAFVTVGCLASILPIIQFAFLGWYGGQDIDSGICWAMSPDQNSTMYYISMILNAFMPGAIVLVSYGTIIGIVIYQRSTIQQQDLSASKRSSNQEVRNSTVQAGVTFLAHLAACKMLFIVTLLYFLTFVPIIVADHAFSNDADLSELVLYHVCNYFYYVSVCMNFVIYYRMNKNFKQAFKKRVIGLKRGRKSELMLYNDPTAVQTRLDVIA